MSCQRAKSTGDYLWKRVIRIVPAYVLAMSLSYWLGDVCNHFVDLPTPYIINGSVWTLYYEIALYLCIAVMKPFGLLKKEVVGSLAGVLFFVVICTQQSTDTFYSIALPMIFMFVFGSYVYLSGMEATVERAGIWAVLGLLLIQFCPSVFDLATQEFPLIYAPDIGRALLMSVYLVSLPTVVLWLGRVVKISLPRFPDLSYGVYLFGWPIQQSVIYYFLVVKGQGITPPLLLLLSSVISLIVAAISWYALEKHALKTKNWYWYAAEKVKQLFSQWHLSSK